MRRTLAILVSVLLLSVAACGKKKREDPILRLSSEEALEIGKQLLEEKKYYKAEKHLTHAFEVEPNSRNGREALLLAADALYLRGGLDNYIRCEAKYLDFINRFPTSDRADYAQFQVGNCLANRVEKPDRDQKVTRKALEAYEELLRLYPTSPYSDEARQKILEVNDLLAAHELSIASFYLRYGRGALCVAAIKRLERVREEFPQYSDMDAALFRLGEAYSRCRRFDESDAAWAELRDKYPDSEFVPEASKLEEANSKKRDNASS
jgi:outer membrane protein assembly factor BamD